MKDNNFEEYKDTIHAKNRTGVKAVCSDCHVPHDFLGTVIRKINASNDVVQHFAGKIDTKEKFEAHRLELAKKVWLRMKETDSKECRQCHDVTAMDPEKQGKTARKQHQKLASGERTCIDCHYGIAHKEPAGGLVPADALEKASE
jgi:cytochrome c-type protein NapC